jgi:hypothetical protein
MQNFVIGVVSSVVAAWILWSLAVLRSSWSLRKMKGVWLEVIDDSARRYSLGTFKFSFWSKRYRYDGHSYQNDGTRSFRWETVGAFFDAEHSKFLYIYEATPVGASLSGHGFGLISVPKGGKGLAETDGYFVDVEKENPREHRVRFFRADAVADKELIVFKPNDEATCKNLIQELVRKNWPDGSAPVGASIQTNQEK